MGISVARLRVGLVVGAVLLTLLVAGFLGYARYRTHRFLAGLPGKLGIDIRRETNGYTYSQSVKGKTVMTLHAAKAVEHSSGKITLHDVSMVLYGRKQERADQISGSEFEYDQASGVVRAAGEVHIDLQAPATTGSARCLEDEGKRIIHVKTSGLVYLQKLGVAATDQDIEFRFGEMTGHAKGAEYNSDTGILILQSAVKANGLERGRPMVLTASHAELDRAGNQALLTEAKYLSPGQSARGDHAIVHLRGDGSPERIEAEGNVALESPTAGKMTAPRADVLLNAEARAQDVHLFGGARYVDLSSLREGRGEAEDVRVAFDAAGQPRMIVLAGGVHLNERVRAVEALRAGWSVRDAVASKMTFILSDDGGGRHSVLRTAEAETAARLTLTSDAGAAGTLANEIAADRLQGEFIGTGKSAELSRLRGSGHTFLRRVDARGTEQTSTGDTLEATLRPAAKRASRQSGVDEVALAVQSGHVALTSKAAMQAGAKTTPAAQRAVAEQAVFNGDTDQLTLSGSVTVTDEQGTVAAGRIILERESGDAVANSTVKATYLQANGAEPVHVLADRAELQHAAGRAVFHGASQGPARLWQGASQVEAPVLDFEHKESKLTARGEGGSTPMVHAVLVGGEHAGKPSQHKQGASSVVRVASRSMIYRDAGRQVDFSGGVTVEDAEGTLRAREATAYLHEGSGAPAPASNDHAGASNGVQGVSFGGGVDRIVAKGSVEIEQPGRRAAGDQLVYTAADGLFVLTGSAGSSPRLIDDAQGTVTGSALRFHSGDRSVVVVGADSDSPAQRVHTVTRVKQP